MLDNILFGIIKYDALILLIQMLVIVFAVYLRHTNNEIPLFLFYGLLTLFSYNLYIKGVQDYNIPIARNFINKVQLFGPVYIVDLIIILFFLYYCYRFLVGRKKKFKLKKVKIFIYHIGYNALIYLFCTTGFLFYILYGEQFDLTAQIRSLRGLLVGITSMLIYLNLTNKQEYRENKKIISVLSTFLLIDAVNILGQICSAILFSDFVWQRGGRDVILVDQASSLLAASYIPFLIKNKVTGNKLFVFAWCMLVISFYNYIKTYILILPFIFLLYLLLQIKIKKIHFIQLTISMILLGSMSIYIPYILKDKAIAGTRVTQFDSYLLHINDNYMALIAGSGEGGKYPVYTDTDDGGEIKEVDREGNSIYQVEFQAPLLVYFKTSGFIGVILLVLFSVFLFACVTPFTYKNKSYQINEMLIVSLLLLSPPLLSSSPNIPAYFSKILIYSILLKALSVTPEGKYLANIQSNCSLKENVES
jgi:hypothetical protein